MHEIRFKKLDETTMAEFRALAAAYPYLSSAYSPGLRFMWRETYPTEFAVESEYLLVRIRDNGRFSYLFPHNVGTIKETGVSSLANIFDILDEHAEDTGELLRFVSLDDSQVAWLCKRYKNYRLSANRLRADYLYLTADLAGFAGRKYSAQRNHIKHFEKNYPDAVFRQLTPADDGKIREFFDAFSEDFTKSSKYAQEELAYAKEYTLSPFKDGELTYGVELSGRLIAICVGEKFGDCIDVQIEKCLPGYDGCYPFVVNEFAKQCLGLAKYMNREDDAGDKGLRTSKLRYRPVRLIPNSIFEIKGELADFAGRFEEEWGEEDDLISAVVALSEAGAAGVVAVAGVVSAGDSAAGHVSAGERIGSASGDAAAGVADVGVGVAGGQADAAGPAIAAVISLSKLRDSDSDDYDRLCLDDEHNRLWGYDYRKDIPEPQPGDFLAAAKSLLAAGSALSLAIRLDGKFIGEVVYFVVDGKGGAKLGWRLLPEYCGKGLAATAFRMAGDFGLYTIGFAKLKAYCYRENVASAKAIEKSMKCTGEDEKFIYFEREA